MVLKFPHFFSGRVVRGFGRGGKDLDCPTGCVFCFIFIDKSISFFLANLDDDAVESFPKNIEDGVFVGYAKVDDGELYPMLMSIGNNPQYGNTKKSIVNFLFILKQNYFLGSSYFT